ncbi:MAG: Flp family type IVb pilin [Acidimicrobiia bacterium]|nr:Flp family type IVb pilin [Acidimicrobiia bacterium]
MTKMAILKSETGANLAEYGILVVLIAVVAMTAVAFVGNELSGTYSDIGSEMVKAGA